MPLTSEELAGLHDIVAAGEDGRKVDLFEVAYAMPVGQLYALAGMFLRQRPAGEDDEEGDGRDVGENRAQYYALYAESVELAEATGSPRPLPIEVWEDWKNQVTDR